MKNVLKNKKFLIFLAIVAVAAAVIVGVLVGGAPKRHNASLKKNMQKSLGAIAADCGLENFEVVYVDDNYWTKIILACDNMSEISYDKKTKFFDDAEEEMKNKGAKFEFYDTEKVAIYSDGNRYTAATDTLTSKIYENGNVIDPTTNKIKVSENASEVESASSESSSKPSSSSSSTSSKPSACKGGVSCRTGFHPCHPMSNGYCNQCCKD